MLYLSIHFILTCLIVGQLVNGFQTNNTRTRRQANSCDGFRCKKGSRECIDEDKVCDGKADCQDKSDETNSCHRFNCPAFLYRCKYGACINSNLVCDGNKDCLDGSDELSCGGKGPEQGSEQNQHSGNGKKCHPRNEFRCSSGQCIDVDGKCDGVEHCLDGSDETAQLCSRTVCPRFTYTCAYGACVNGNARCNGVKECRDNSDEEDCPTLQPPITDVPERVDPTPAPTPAPVPQPGVKEGSCTLPNHPVHGKWTLFGATRTYSPGEAVNSGSLLNINCEERYTPVGDKLIYCNQGRWSNSVAQCEVLCPPYVPTKTTNVTCTYRKIPVSCSEARSGTVAKFTCAPFHEDLQLLRTPNRICQDGSWDLGTPKCTPVCGQKRVVSTPLIVNGHRAVKGDYPWQVGLYNNDKEFLCGGSLINQRVVLSAAHCVTDLKGNMLPKQNYVVAVGKYYRDFSDSRDKEAQYSTLYEIVKAEEYKGDNLNFLGDIALLITNKIFELSTRVQPICVDWGLFYQEQLTEPGAKGIVTGWGLTTNHGELSNELKELETPYIQYSQCAIELPQDYDRYLSHDKMCSGYLNQSTGVCKGDSGGGLVARNRYDGRYYVTGIVSISPVANGSCNTQLYTLYTKVSTYIPFIFEIERKYSVNI